MSMLEVVDKDLGEEEKPELETKAAVASYAGTGRLLVTSEWSAEVGAQPECLAVVGPRVQAHGICKRYNVVRLM